MLAMLVWRVEKPFVRELGGLRHAEYGGDSEKPFVRELGS